MRGMGKSEKGSITVLLALTFLLISSILAVLVESGRRQGARVMVSMAGTLAMDQMFSNYETGLLERFGVLLFDGGCGNDEVDESAIINSLSEGMRCNLDTDADFISLKGHDFYGIVVDDIRINQIIKPTDAYGLVWRSMICDYAKVDYTAEMVEAFLGIEDKLEEGSKIAAIVQEMDQCYEISSDMNQAYLELIEKIDGVNCMDSGIDFNQIKVKSDFIKKNCSMDVFLVTGEVISIADNRVYEAVSGEVFDINGFFRMYLDMFKRLKEGNIGELSNVVSFSRMIRTFLSTTKRLTEESIRIIESFRGDRLSLEQQLLATESILSTITSEISLESLDSLTGELQEIQQYYGDISEKELDLDGIYEVLKHNNEILMNTLSYCKDISVWETDDAQMQEQREQYYADYCQAAEQIKGYRTDEMYLDYTGLEASEENNDLLGCIYDYVESGICGLVLPSDSEVSQKRIDISDLASDYGIRGNRDIYIEEAGTNVVNEMIFNFYLRDWCGNYLNLQGEGLLDYELEYILFGGNSDKGNLTSAITAIAGIRMACNLASIYTNSEKKTEAAALAASVLGVTGIPILISGLKHLILMAWTVGETIMDLKRLMRGEKIPLIKKNDEWKLSLAQLISGNLVLEQVFQIEKESEENRFSFGYEDYLCTLLVLSDSQEKAFRSMDIAELYMIGNGVENFRLKNYVYGLDAVIRYHLGTLTTVYEEHCVYTY